jgi:hypothetical protein
MLVAWAVAAVPDGVTPVLAPGDAPQQYADWLQETGAPPVRLACDALWAEALVCFKVVDGSRRRWVTEADAKNWGVDVPGLRRVVTDRARQKLAQAPKVMTVEGMPKSKYWLSAEGDGWAAAGVLAPDTLASRIGGAPLLVATPVDGVLLVWKPGDADLDRVLAVGAKEMHDASDSPVTPVVHGWDGTRWFSVVEAVPTAPVAPSIAPEPPRR